MAANRKEISVETVLAATNGALVRGPRDRVFPAVVIDGRNVPSGALFFAIKGERHDGHDFAAQAVGGGARGVVVARGRGATLTLDLPSEIAVIEVDDTVLALGALARAWRESLGVKVVGVAGSNGKTTTKELIASILVAHAGADAVLKTEGNLNNHLGVPLTILRLTENHRFAVVEMGMSAPRELAYLGTLAQPDVGIIVSIAIEHLEGLGSIEGVAAAEAEILESASVCAVPAHERLLDPHVAAARARGVRFVTFGEPPADVPLDEAIPDATGVRMRTAGLTPVEAHLPLVGAHNALNAAGAIAVALTLGVPAEAIARGLANVKPAKHRAQLVPVGDRVVLDDCYNASPLSMRAALDALVAAAGPGRRRVAVLADMLELGPDAPQLHDEIGAYASSRVDSLIALGPLGARYVDAARPSLGDRAVVAADPDDAAARALAASGPGDVILVKASRGMKLERVIDALATRLSGGAR
jgi:UDP-N-acetylmuramoyl-tripeptide--D-alanyl-D-alanine ligase